MKHGFFFTGLVMLLVLFLSGTVVNAADGWSIPVSGPDGEVMIDVPALSSLISERGIPTTIEGENVTGIPLWRIIRLADNEKTLGPGDIIQISGDTVVNVPYQTTYKNDAYLFIPGGTPSLNGASGSKDSSVTGIQSIQVTQTDDWVLTLNSDDETIEVTRDIWNNVTGEGRAEITDSEGRVFSGIPLFTLIESQGITPGAGTNLTISGQDRYSVEIPWANITGNADFILSDKMNDELLPKYIDLGGETGNTPAWPLMVIDPDFPGNNSVGNVAEISALN